MGCTESKAPKPQMMFPVEEEDNGGYERALRVSRVVGNSKDQQEVKDEVWFPWLVPVTMSQAPEPPEKSKHSDKQPVIPPSTTREKSGGTYVQTEIGGNVKAEVYVHDRAWVMPMPPEFDPMQRDEVRTRETGEKRGGEIPVGEHHKDVPTGERHGGSGNRLPTDSTYVSSSASSNISRKGKQQVDISKHSKFRDLSSSGVTANQINKSSRSKALRNIVEEEDMLIRLLKYDKKESQLKASERPPTKGQSRNEISWTKTPTENNRLEAIKKEELRRMKAEEKLRRQKEEEKMLRKKADEELRQMMEEELGRKKAEEELHRQKEDEEKLRRKKADEELIRTLEKELLQKKAEDDLRRQKDDEEKRRKKADEELIRNMEKELLQKKAEDDLRRQKDDEEKRRIKADKELRKTLEEELRKKKEHEELLRKKAEEELRRQTDELNELRRQREEEERRRMKAEEELRRKREEEELQKKKAEEELQKKMSEEEELRRKREQEELNRKKVEDELRRQKAEVEELLRQRDKEELKRKKAEKLQKKAEEELHKKMAEEEELRRKREQEEVLRKKAEEDLHRKKEEEELKKKKAEEEQNRKKAEEEELRRKKAEEEVGRMKAEEELRLKNEKEELNRKKAEEMEQRRKREEEDELRRKKEEEDELRRKREEEELRRKEKGKQEPMSQSRTHEEMQRISLKREHSLPTDDKLGSFKPPTRHTGEKPNESWERVVECPDLKCDKRLPLKHLLEHIHHKHPFALWIGKIENNFISRQYWNIKSTVNFKKDSNTWVLTLWEFDGHHFIATFTRFHGSWYSWVYICAHSKVAERYIVEVRIVNEARGSGVSYRGRVHPIDQRGEEIRQESDCFVLTDDVVKHYMTSAGLSDARKNEGYDYRIPIEYKIFKK